VIAAGGTAGHVVPALAVAGALRDSGAEVSFLGTRDGPEGRLVPAAGYEIDYVKVRGIDRTSPLRAVKAAAMAVGATAGARKAIRRRRADAVLGAGGYVAGPAGLAAASLRLPLVLSEADRHLGLTNRMLAGRARRVCLAFPIEGRNEPRYVVTGRPIPAGILTADRAAARERVGIDPDARCLLVFGGSQGARSINLAAIEAFAGPGAAGRDFHVLHISGSRDHADCAAALAGAPASDRYALVEYEPGLADVLAACDLVLARAGGSIFEVAAAKRPSILVPYPHATGDHQHANARWMADGGAAVVVEDSALDPAGLRELVAGLFADGSRLEAMGAAAAALARPDAAARSAAALLAASGPTGRR
jgi:UDP-N-acetylglucosamine--N-acetylmuramyl-(pentapeptide) pyrophosphoryl-undecaprenol N-acetylglucosamine transferase